MKGAKAGPTAWTWWWCPRPFFYHWPWKQCCLVYLPMVTVLLILTWTTSTIRTSSIIYYAPSPIYSHSWENEESLRFLIIDWETLIYYLFFLYICSKKPVQFIGDVSYRITSITVVCILVRTASFPRNHTQCRKEWYLIWNGCLFPLT